MRSTASFLLGWLLRLGVGLAILALIWHSVDTLKIREVVRSFELPAVALALALYFGSWLLAAYKWQLLVPSAPIGVVARVTFVSQFYGFFLPGQLGGEISRAILMARLGDDTDKAVASVLVDRITGLVGLCLVAWVGIQAGPVRFEPGIQLAFAALGAAAAGSLFLLRVGWFDALVRRSLAGLLASRSRWLQAPGRFFTRAHDALLAFASNGRLMVASVSLGVLFQMLCVAINYVLAVQLGIAVSVFDLAWIVGAVSVALLLPISVAGIGVRELTYVGLLGLFGVAAEKALILSLAVLALAACGALLGAALEARRLLARPRAG